MLWISFSSSSPSSLHLSLHLTIIPFTFSFILPSFHLFFPYVPLSFLRLCIFPWIRHWAPFPVIDSDQIPPWMSEFSDISSSLWSLMTTRKGNALINRGRLEQPSWFQERVLYQVSCRLRYIFVNCSRLRPTRQKRGCLFTRLPVASSCGCPARNRSHCGICPYCPTTNLFPIVLTHVLCCHIVSLITSPVLPC